MEEFLLVLRLLLAVIFAVAGVAKFADLAGTRKSLEDFDVPRPLVPVFSLLLPTAEIAVAVAMLFIEISWYAAIAAIVLLAVFSAGMIVQMVRGRAPDCHCFGQLHSEPVSSKSLVRNIVFVVPAVVLAVSGPARQGLALSAITVPTAQVILTAVGVVLLGAVLLSQRKIAAKQREIVERIETLELEVRDSTTVQRDEAGDPHDGLPIGAPLPSFVLRARDGAEFDTAALRVSTRPTLLLFVNPACGPCRSIVPKAAIWAAEFANRLQVLFVSSGTVEENIEAFGADVDLDFLRQDEREFAQALGAQWNPSALFISGDGRIASHVAAGDTAIESLVDKIRTLEMNGGFDYVPLKSGDSSAAKIRIGEAVPDFLVTAIAGERIKAGDLLGRQTLVAFWSPTCGHCVTMIDQFKNWGRIRGADDPELLVFSDGNLDLHRDIGLESPLILDKHYRTAQKLGMVGTPSAVLIGEDGRFASELAIGAPNIWALVGRRVQELQ